MYNNAKTEEAFFPLENQGKKGSRSALARLVNPTLGASQRGKLTMKSDDFSVGHCVIAGDIRSSFKLLIDQCPSHIARSRTARAQRGFYPFSTARLLRW